MKRTVLTVICLILSVMCILSGCVQYTTNLPTDAAADNNEEQYVTETVTYYVPATDDAGEDVTDAEGEHVYVVVSEVVTVEAAGDDVNDNEEDNGNSADNSGNNSGNGSTATTSANGGNSQTGTTSANGRTEATTSSKNGKTEATTSSTGSKTETTTNASSSSVNQYDIFRSGTFYAKGSMKDSEGSTPLEIAITPKSIYMVTKMENIDMGILVNDGKTYLMYPAEKTYLEMSSTIMSMMGLDTDDLISSDDLGFSDLEPLSKADKTETGTFNGKSCTVYTFTNDDGTSSKVYMSGNTLLGLETVSGGSVVSATYFDYITGTVPADKITPPANYTKSGIFDFMSLLTEVME